jgi:superfamily II DNA helicase RecQ
MEPKDNPRATAVLEWLESFTGKAAIWAYYREDIKIIAELLTEAGITFVEYHGGVCDNDRVLAVKSFMSKDGARVLLATPLFRRNRPKSPRALQQCALLFAQLQGPR